MDTNKKGDTPTMALTQQILDPEGKIALGLQIDQTALGMHKRVRELDEQIKQFAKIASVTEYEFVAEIQLKAAKLEKEGEEFYEVEVKRLYSAWKDKTTERASITEPAKAIKDRAGQLTAAWQQEQERLRQEEQRRQEEIARKRAEDEALAEAKALQDEGRHEEADALLEAPLEIEPVMVNSYVPTIHGISKPRDNYQAEITNLLELVKAVAKGKVPLQAIEANMTFLNQMARAQKQTLNYAGVRVVNRPKTATRS
jgi:hypothetical protein